MIVSEGNLRLGDGSSEGFEFAGTLLVLGGDTVVLRDADLSHLGILTKIGSGGRLVTAGGVEVGAGDQLSGSGAIAGNVIVRAGGQVSPGSSIGVVSTDVGDVRLLENAIYIVEIGGAQPGTQYDQLSVQGTVDVEGAILSLSGQFRPAAGTKFTLIDNDGNDAVNGRFRSATGALLGEGSTVRFGGIEARLSYADGNAGNDVTLTMTSFQFVMMPSSSSSSSATDTLQLIFAAAITEANRRSILISTDVPVWTLESLTPPIKDELGDVRTKSLEVRAADQMRLFFRIVNEGTNEEDPKEYALDPKELRDLLGIFKRYRFPDGKYRVYLQEPDRNPRRILEINILEGRVVPPNFRDTERSSAPTEEAKPVPGPRDQGVEESPLPRRAALAATVSDPDWRDRIHAALSSDNLRQDRIEALLRKVRDN